MQSPGPMVAPNVAPAPSEPRQRWRVVYRRRPDAPLLQQREQLAAWEASLVVSGLPLAGLDLRIPRPRLVFAAPLAVGMAAERELVDLFLVDRWPVAEVRVRLAGSLPAGHELIDMYDVWLGQPPLSGQVVAADYRVEVGVAEGGGPDRAALRSACARLLGASTLPRTRDKGGRSIPYDLRRLVADVEVVAGGGAVASSARLELRIQTRFDPDRGVGRPEEVLAALSELAGVLLQARSIVRERLRLTAEA